MSQFNYFWYQKYTIFRNELISVKSLLCIDSNCCIEQIKERFLSCQLVETSYPVKITGVRYSLGLPSTISEGCVCRILERSEKLHLWFYYHLELDFYDYSK